MRFNTPSESPTPSASALARLARDLYTEGPYLMRKMMHFRLVICPLERLLPHVPPGSSVLDAGCGAGAFLAFLASTVPGISGTGFDFSRPAIQTALRMVERAKRNGRPFDLRFEQLQPGSPWPAGPFDVVSLVDVLHHVPVSEQKNVIQQAMETVKPGGILLYKDLASRPRFDAFLNRMHDLILARQWIHYVPAGDVERWAAEGGFRLEFSENVSRLWYNHELRIFRKPSAPITPA